MDDTNGCGAGLMRDARFFLCVLAVGLVVVGKNDEPAILQKGAYPFR